MIPVFYTIQNSKLATVEGIHNFSSVREQIKVKEKGNIGKASEVLHLHFQTAF